MFTQDVSATAYDQMIGSLLAGLEEHVNPPQEQDLDKSWAEFARRTKIRSGKRVVPFDPYDYQILVSDLIDAHYATVITKVRQLGLTELVASKFLFKAVNNPAYLAVVFSKSQEDTNNIAKRVRQMAASHPEIELLSDSVTEIAIKGGGRILFKPSTINAGRSLESVSDILFDECAFVKDISDIYGAALPATSMVGDEARIIILSTPNGKNNFYFNQLASNNGDRDILKICKDVREGNIDPVQYWTDEEDWCKVVLHWKAHPVYSVADKSEKLKAKGGFLGAIKSKMRITEAQLQREYNLSFDDAEETPVIDPDWWGRYNSTPPYSRFVRIIQSWDTAQKAQDWHDPWACLTVGETDNGMLYLLNVFNRRMEYPEGKRTAIRAAFDWEPHAILIEDKSTGGSLIQEFYEGVENPDGSNPGIKRRFNVIGMTPCQDKETRMRLESPALEAGKMWLPSWAEWLQETEDEFNAFPNGSKNRVDALSQLLNWVRLHPAKSELQEKEEFSTGKRRSLYDLLDIY